MARVLAVLIVAALLSGCAEAPPASGNARVLMMGDSLFAVHRGSRRSVSDRLEKMTGAPVVDRSFVGAQYLYALPISGRLGLRISRQYVAGDWDWVILNGGGNDLWLACGCRACEEKLNRLISADGSRGEIVNVVARARAGGARVLYVGYLRSPGVASSIDHCATYGDVLEARLSRMAQADKGVTFLPLDDLVPSGDRSFHDSDLIHPSHKGSAAIAGRIAPVLQGR